MDGRGSENTGLEAEDRMSETVRATPPGAKKAPRGVERSFRRSFSLALTAAASLGLVFSIPHGDQREGHNAPRSPVDVIHRVASLSLSSWLICCFLSARNAALYSSLRSSEHAGQSILTEQISARQIHTKFSIDIE